MRVTKIKNGIEAKDILLPSGYKNETSWLPSDIL